MDLFIINDRRCFQIFFTIENYRLGSDVVLSPLPTKGEPTSHAANADFLQQILMVWPEILKVDFYRGAKQQGSSENRSLPMMAPGLPAAHLHSLCKLIKQQVPSAFFGHHHASLIVSAC